MTSLTLSRRKPSRQNLWAAVAGAGCVIALCSCEPKGEEAPDLEVLAAPLTGDEIKFGNFDFALSQPLPEIDLLTTDAGFKSDFPSYTLNNLTQFRFSGNMYLFKADKNILLGPKSLPENALLTPKGTKFSGGKITVPGRKSVDAKALGLVFGIAKANKTEKRTSAILKKTYGTDFGLIPPKLVKGIIGYGGYSYGQKAAGGLSIPKGYGVGKGGRSFYGDYLKGRPVGPLKKESWRHFLQSWSKGIGNKAKYLSRVEKALGGDKALAKKIWIAENANLTEEVAGFVMIDAPACGCISYQGDKVRLHLGGPGRPQLLYTTDDPTANTFLANLHAQLLSDLNWATGQATWRLSLVRIGVVLGTALSALEGVLPGIAFGTASTGGYGALALDERDKIRNIYVNYNNAVNSTLQQFDFQAVPNIVNF